MHIFRAHISKTVRNFYMQFKQVAHLKFSQMKPYIGSGNHRFSNLIFKIVFALVFSVIFYSEANTASNPTGLMGDKDVLLINPAYKIKRMSTGLVIAYSAQKDGESVRHEFENIYADVLLGAVRKQSVNQLIPILARKYYYPIDECRREIKHAVHVLEEWEILLSDDVLH